MTMTKEDSKKIDKLFQKMEDIRVDTSAIKEHLKMLNHRTEKSETCITELQTENKKQNIMIAKATATSAIVVAIAVYLIQTIIG